MPIFKCYLLTTNDLALSCTLVSGLRCAGMDICRSYGRLCIVYCIILTGLYDTSKYVSYLISYGR
jgi:hypothetical protein